MVWIHGDPMLLVGDGPRNMPSGEGLDPLVYDPDIHDDVGKLSVESPR